MTDLQARLEKVRGLVRTIPHHQHTVWKDGIDIEECWPDCVHCKLEQLLADLPAAEPIFCEQCDKEITNDTYLCSDCWNRVVASKADLPASAQPASSVKLIWKDDEFQSRVNAVIDDAQETEGQGVLTEMCPTCGERYAKGVACDLCAPQPTESTAREPYGGLDVFVIDAREQVRSRGSADWVDLRNLLRIIDEQELCLKAALACGGTEERE